jgi:hypothetical protein
MELRVAGLERTLVDVLDRPDLSGSWEEIWRSLESVEFFDLDKVVEYALLRRKRGHRGEGGALSRKAPRTVDGGGPSPQGASRSKDCTTETAELYGDGLLRDRPFNNNPYAVPD